MTLNAILAQGLFRKRHTPLSQVHVPTLLVLIIDITSIFIIIYHFRWTRLIRAQHLLNPPHQGNTPGSALRRAHTWEPQGADP